MRGKGNPLYWPVGVLSDSAVRRVPQAGESVREKDSGVSGEGEEHHSSGSEENLRDLEDDTQG